MTYSLKAPNTLNANIQLSPSKSISNRALIICHLTKNAVLPQNLSVCDDTQVLRQALSAQLSGDSVINIGAAGTAMRFLTAYFSASDKKVILTGNERMQQRPIKPLVEALRSLGADIEYAKTEGFPPLIIKGKKLQGGSITLKADISSQFISALLMIAPTLENGLTVHISGKIVSRPYIDLTLNVMKHYGAKASWTSEESIEVLPSPYKATPLNIENDWSAAAFWYEIMALCPDTDARINLKGLSENSPQSDALLKDYFLPLGVKTDFTNEGISLHNQSAPLSPYKINLINNPDIAQAIAVTCAMQKRPFEISGLNNLRFKECDRINALATELNKFGITINTTDDTISWNGNQHHDADNNIVIDTYEDHRMAMAFAPCAFAFNHITINQPFVVSKSFPNFWAELQHCGFNITKL